MNEQPKRDPYPRAPLWWLGFAMAVATVVAAPAVDAEEPGPGTPAKGRFLIASRELLDPNFVQTVVLLVDYSSEGAMGVIVNRPTKTRVAKVLPELDEVQERDETVWVGGPVATWQMVLLARSTMAQEGTQIVFEDVIFSGSSDVLKRLIGEDGEFRIYAGHAGWAPGQLEREIDRGGWHVLPAKVDMVFDSAPHDLWLELIRRSAVQWTSLIPATDETWLDARRHPARE